MAAYANRESASGNLPPMPLDLKLDLLVDGELPDEQREILLQTIEHREEPEGSWRDVALRFLQRQTEQQAVRRLMAGGNVVPVDFVPRLSARRHILGRIHPLPLMAAAAGLLIAATSALITLYAVRPSTTTRSPAMAEFRTLIPADVISASEAVPITVPMYRAADNAMVLPVSDENDAGLTRRSVIIQSDGGDGFIMIPVSTSKTKVY
jgi:hypothetical protein